MLVVSREVCRGSFCGKAGATGPGLGGVSVFLRQRKREPMNPGLELKSRLLKPGRLAGGKVIKPSLEEEAIQLKIGEVGEQHFTGQESLLKEACRVRGQHPIEREGDPDSLDELVAVDQPMRDAGPEQCPGSPGESDSSASMQILDTAMEGKIDFEVSVGMWMRHPAGLPVGMTPDPVADRRDFIEVGGGSGCRCFHG